MYVHTMQDNTHVSNHSKVPLTKSKCLLGVDDPSFLFWTPHRHLKPGIERLY